MSKSVVFSCYRYGFAQAVLVDYNQIIKVGLRRVLLTLDGKNLRSSKTVNEFGINFFIQNKLNQLSYSCFSVVPWNGCSSKPLPGIHYPTESVTFAKSVVFQPLIKPISGKFPFLVSTTAQKSLFNNPYVILIS